MLDKIEEGKIQSASFSLLCLIMANPGKYSIPLLSVYLYICISVYLNICISEYLDIWISGYLDIETRKRLLWYLKPGK